VFPTQIQANVLQTVLEKHEGHYKNYWKRHVLDKYINKAKKKKNHLLVIRNKKQEASSQER
jgi:hypothetical protein